MIVLIVLSLLSYSLCEESSSSPKYPENTADISSINNLAYKPPITLDPRIRKALLNVLNRLEEQERVETTDTKSDAKKYEQQQQIFDTKSNPKQHEQEKPVTDDVKWEFKPYDSGKDYGYYEIIQDKPSPTSLVTLKSSEENRPDKEQTEDEPGALFFQLPHKQQEPSKEKHESLNLQETKSALTSDLIFGQLEDEIKHEHKNAKDSNNTSSSHPETAEDEVEVFQAPLLTAFTLEQDERGLPRRIIPLDTVELSSILDNKINVDPTQEIRKAREQQKTRSSDPPALPQNEEQKRYQLNLESQLQQLQEQKRRLDLEKQRFLFEQEKQKLLAEQENTRRLKIALELRDREHFLRSIKQNEIPRQDVALQKSIPLEIYNKPVIIQPLPVIPLVQYKPQFEFPDTVDKQLQNLFQKSGITQGKHEDLNIVSKVLALNYDEKDKPKISAERLFTNPGHFRNKRIPKDHFWNN